MRDTRKDKKYFEEYIDYQYSRIEGKIAKLEEADEEKKQRILVSLTGFELDLLKAEFSMGAAKEKIRAILNRTAKIVSEYKNIVYEDLLNVLSLAVIVNEKSEAVKLIKNNKDRIENDRLLNFLSMHIQGKKVKWNKKLQIPDEYSGLNKVFEAEDKEAGLLQYLNEWYENHSEYGWYNSHLGGSDTYCGYWSFESAAIAVIMGLDESRLKDSVYYPCF